MSQKVAIPLKKVGNPARRHGSGKEAHVRRGDFVYGSGQPGASLGGILSLSGLQNLVNRPADIGFYGLAQLLLFRELRVYLFESWHDAVNQVLNAGQMFTSSQLVFQRRLYCAAPFMTENNKEGRAQMRSRILETTHHFRRDHVPGDAYDEQLSKVGVEDQFGRHARVTAAQDGRERLLAFGQVGKCFFAHSGKTSLAAFKPLVAFDQFLQSLVGS